jgi:hypothetical protein
MWGPGRRSLYAPSGGCANLSRGADIVGRAAQQTLLECDVIPAGSPDSRCDVEADVIVFAPAAGAPSDAAELGALAVWGGWDEADLPDVSGGAPRWRKLAGWRLRAP